MTLIRFSALVIAQAGFVTYTMTSLAHGLEPFTGETAATYLAAAPLLTLLAVWGWYLYGPPRGVRAEFEKERRQRGDL